MKMPTLFLGLFCFFFSVIDTEILQQLITIKLREPPVVRLTPMCDRVLVEVQKRHDTTVKRVDRSISCELLDSYIYNSNYLILSFGNKYKGEIEVNGYKYNVIPGENVTVVSNNLTRVYVIIRIGLAILALYLLRKKYFYDIFPAALVTSLVLLYFPGTGSFDILGYLQFYNNFPNYLDNEYSLARLLPFFITKFLTNSIFVYKLAQVYFCSFSVLAFVRVFITNRRLQVLAFVLTVFISNFFHLAYSYTDLIFVGILLLKLTFLVGLLKGESRLSWYIVFSIFIAVYRSNSIVLILFDIVLFIYLKLSKKLLATYSILLAIVYGISFGVIVDEADTGYGGYAVLYELHPLYEKYPEDLRWMTPFFRRETLSRPRGESFISTYYRGDNINEDLIDRDQIAEHYEDIYLNYTRFALRHPFEVVKQKIILFTYFLGLNVNHDSVNLSEGVIRYFYLNNGDFKFFNKDRSREVPIFKTMDLSVFRWLLSNAWISSLIFPFLLIFVVLKRMKIETIVLICAILYTLSFLVFSHGYLLNYSYYIVILVKIFFVRFYEIWRGKC